MTVRDVVAVVCLMHTLEHWKEGACEYMPEPG